MEAHWPSEPVVGWLLSIHSIPIHWLSDIVTITLCQVYHPVTLFFQSQINQKNAILLL